jgi:ribosomal protein L11 methyltransferase
LKRHSRTIVIEEKNAPLRPQDPVGTKWIEISATLNPFGHEALGAFLFDLGCEGIVTQSPQDDGLKAYLPFREDLEGIRTRIDQFLQELSRIMPEIGVPRFSLGTIEDQDWNRNWRRFFRPEKVTRQLLIVPAWESVPDSRDTHVIRMDPGPAFGTGQHPTTRMCLQAMEDLIVGGRWTLLDVGTGSGILSLYGVILRAGRVVALDIDPEAIRWAKRNANLNALAGKITFTTTPLEKIQGPFSVVTANIVMSTILDLLPHLARVLERKGWLILSGLLRNQVPFLEKVLKTRGLMRGMVLEEDEWACLIVRNLDVAP